MAKKAGRYEPIDEDFIRNLIGGVDVPPRLAAKADPVPLAPEASSVKPVKSQPDETKEEDGTEPYKAFVDLFLRPRQPAPDTTCRIERRLKEKLGLIVRMLGSEEMTVKSYLNNIIADHLEHNKEEINKLFSKPKTLKL